MERDTRQRRAIRNALREAGHPLSPQEILDRGRREVEGLGIATVYRNIRALEDQGWVVPVELPGEPPRYEVAGKAHHHHFHCRACDRVYEVTECPADFANLTPAGFVLEEHEFVLYGRCASCAN